MSGRFARRSCRSALVLLGLALLHAANVHAQTGFTSTTVGTGLLHIRSISPRSGPAGTAVKIQADALPINSVVWVALASTHAGYEVVAHNLRADAEGRFVTTITIPEQHRGHWDHAIVIMLLNEESQPIASSDPFHITNDAGLVRRTGVVDIAHPGCPVLKGWDGVDYALLGRKGASMIASVRHEAVIEGTVVEGSCGLQNAIDVTRASVPMLEP